MKVFFSIFLIISTTPLCFANRSVNLNENLNLAFDDFQLIEIEPQIFLGDSIETFIVDDYPVTNEMFREFRGDNLSMKIQSGEIFSLGKAWFSNDTINQTLVFDLYTDFHRMAIFHFYNQDIPTKIINSIGLSMSKSKFNNVFEPAGIELKKKYFNGFIKKSKIIDKSFFITTHGFKLGDNINKAIKFYGQPDSVETDEGIEQYQWNFIGDYTFDEYNEYGDILDLKGKPVAKNSFGYHITMYFKNGKLIGQIIVNAIP